MPSPAAVVFDLDGTLVDTLPDLLGALNGVLAELARPPLAADDVRLMVGEGAAALIDRGLAATGGAPPGTDRDCLIRRFIAIYAARPAAESRVFPGAVRALDRLAAAGHALGICTNKPQGLSHAVLDGLGLARHFPVVIGGDALPWRKPDARHLGAVLDRLGVAPADAVYVGDSPTDVAAARATGVPVIAVRFGYSRVAPEALGADLVIDHHDALIEAVRRLAG
ncbi:MAG: phosphoglycolate phosphatase [Alphaproteobacteria bacterium]|nr:phosphoglycolate phosphatase [Alphaproteobacteria bacterium]